MNHILDFLEARLAILLNLIFFGVLYEPEDKKIKNLKVRRYWARKADL